MNKLTKQDRMERDLWDFCFYKIDRVLDRLSTKPGLYRIYNKRRKLIYVGISENIKRRIKYHLRGYSDKPGLTKQMYYIKYHNIPIEQARKLEEELVRLINPFFNGMPPGNNYYKENKYEKVYFPWDYPFIHSKHEFFAKKRYFIILAEEKARGNI